MTRQERQQKPKTCYLCGKTIAPNCESKDHVPPQQFCAKELRVRHNVNLLTLKTHAECNSGFKKDEDYVAHHLAQAAFSSYTGEALLKEHFKSYRSGNPAEIAKLRDVVSKTRGDIVLPGGLVYCSADGRRCNRVIWKVVRGLFFHHEKSVLPEGTAHRIWFVPPPQKPPEFFALLDQSPNLGKHQGLFDYRYRCLPEVEGDFLWAMLLWDRLIFLVLHHYPSCSCNICT